ncbi:CE1 family esterase [Sulfitobacter guttiformis]|uniref:Polyhydroxybutyrate depolymerase n=1 Tax=Sulfitobacter guttiformis TaxID=74349 RepID=A0A420DTG5_9RHOB|nr:polyhydroxybutyrate depolymerase [Sulfitobacter guttiformis]KIN74870.1 putative polyhydroxybutyrate depolymerase [Sulfitobacter guttiformis KCTC 32187]RKE97439.1 polyhydroxybutyrate depolymerase [Sulfitobacter guttiformis]
MKWLLVIWTVLTATALQACGADSDCVVGDRIYRISLPQGRTAPSGAVIWAHGYRGAAEGAMRNASLLNLVHAQGLALIALQGVNGTWDLPNGPRTPDSTGAPEFTYVDRVISDAVERFGVDRTKLVASGFSAGGMLVWNIACAEPEKFTAFIPFSGTFWRGPPAQCDAPVANMIHIHGDDDATVPLDGRAIGATRQGKVSEAMAMYGALGAFGPAEQMDTPDLRCARQGNAAGKLLELCLFEGGHSFRTEYLGYALDRLKAAGQL